jgi:hypothetical protein
MKWSSRVGTLLLHLFLVWDGMVSQKFYDIRHFYYCILIAVKIEKRAGRFQSTLEENLFILSWVKTAQKKKLFPKDVSSELEWVLSLVTPAKLNGNTLLILENVLSKIDLLNIVKDRHE